MINKWFFLLCSVFLFVFNPVFGQGRIVGFVKETDSGNPIMGATLMLWDSLYDKVIAVEFSDVNGVFDINIPKNTLNLELRIKAMGYEMISRILDPMPDGSKLSFVYYLEKAVLRLEDVHIQIQKPIHAHGDTITFNATYFAKGNEQFVHELLKNIPGINVDDNGTIKYGNKEIVKLMVEGADFFEKGYQVLSLNMPAYPIEKVQVLNRFSSNRILSDIQESDQVAINLSLKEGYRSVWFGNSLFGYGLQSKNKLDLRFDLMNFGREKKHYLISQFNNVGNNSFDQIAHFMKSETEEDGFDVEIKRFFTPEIMRIEGVKSSRINFNREFLGSYNTILSLGNHWNIKVNSYLNRDRQQFVRERKDRVLLPDLAYDNQENLKQIVNRSEGFLRIGVQGDPSERSTLNSKTDLVWGDTKNNNYINFNSEGLWERLKNQSLRIGQKTNYSYRIRPKTAALLNFMLVWENNPQLYSLNQSFVQDMGHTLGFMGGEGKLIQRVSPKHAFELSVGQSFRLDRLNLNRVYSKFGSTSYFQQKYSWYPLKRFDLSVWSRMEYNVVLEKITRAPESESQYIFAFDPGFRLNWEPVDKQKFNISYSLNSSFPALQDRISDFVHTGYRSVIKGLDSFNYSKSSIWTLSHQLGDWASGFYIQTISYLIWHHRHISTLTNISQQQILTKKIWVNSPYYFTLQSSMDYFIDPLSSNLKVAIGMSVSNPMNKIVGNMSQNDLFKTFTSSFEIRSGFNGPVNFHLGASPSITGLSSRNLSTRFTKTIDGFSDVYLQIGDRFEISMLYEWYFLNQISTQPILLQSLDSRIKYLPKSKKFQFELVGRNLLNANRYNVQALHEYGYSRTSYGLLPRQLLLKIWYRF
ncbi:MAG TPA: hypothetical protein VKZ78_02970 [Sphingobacteriaceae bacterium]|nr:hypothetical protein [Sphingobacteriaceae bacterium]